MAEVKPFRGLLYNSSSINDDYSSVVAPPYDVISEHMQGELYEKNDYNVIRLVLGKSLESDSQDTSKYTRAREFLNNWLREKILVEDAAESFYIYLQQYEHNGEKHRRIGFMGLMKIEDPAPDTILPHEHTLAKPKEDRMNLIKQVEGNLSPIFSLYDGGGTKIEEILEKNISSEPIIDITREDGSHSLWRLSDSEAIENITSAMKSKKIFIADGHHRYEVVRTYRDMRRQEEDYSGAADYVMMYFADMGENADLTVTATHRAIKMIPETSEREVVSKLSDYFNITECANLSELMNCLEENFSHPHTFGFYGGEKHFCMIPQEKNGLAELITEEKSAEWKDLDVSILHSAVFNKLLSISDTEGNIIYFRDPEKAETLVKEGNCAAAFFLNPTRVEQLKVVAELGEMMPQKSTYFYPKLLTGLVISKFKQE